MLGINFIKSKREADKELFFGPLEEKFWGNETFIEIQEGWVMAHLLHASGVFSSVSEARKNGWNKPIPEGFNSFRAGKNKILISSFVAFNLEGVFKTEEEVEAEWGKETLELIEKVKDSPNEGDISSDLMEVASKISKLRD